LQHLALTLANTLPTNTNKTKGKGTVFQDRPFNSLFYPARGAEGLQAAQEASLLPEILLNLLLQ